LTAILYGIFIDGTFFKLYFVLLAIYTVVCNNLCINKKQITKRRNITITTWDGNSFIYIKIIAPGDPTAYLVIDYDVT
jgi:hypothetical protein